MQKVIGVNLNGVAYQVEEGGYTALVAYLGRAEGQLAGNPDRAEILADLEQAIADKCRAFLGPHKTVVTAAEVERIIAEMGPVDGGAGTGEATGGGAQAAQDAKGADTGAPRRLYQIREGAMLSGVCNGLGAYFNLDPTIVRIIFILLALVTKGLWILVYVVLMFVIPFADTPEQRAAAHGWRFSAQEVIDRAKRQYADFKDSRAWRRQWRSMRQQWRRQWRAARWQPPAWTGQMQEHLWHAGQTWAVATAPLFGLINIALVALLVLAFWSLATTHAVFGYAMPAGVPYWVGFFVLLALYQIVAIPFHPWRWGVWGARPAGPEIWFAPWLNLLWLAFIAFSIWWGFTHVPQVHDFIEQVAASLRQAAQH